MALFFCLKRDGIKSSGTCRGETEVNTMRKLTMNLQLFADGGEGGSGGQGQGAGTGNGGQGGTAGYTYDQLEEIATSRAEKASRAALADFFRKQGMSEEEITTAINDYKTKQKQNQPDVAAVQRERDEANRKLQQYENEKVLTGMKVRAEDLDYVIFKVNALVTDKKDFKTAAQEWLKDNPRYKDGGTYRLSSGTAAGEGTAKSDTGNEAINDMIRTAFGRK